MPPTPAAPPRKSGGCLAGCLMLLLVPVVLLIAVGVWFFSDAFKSYKLPDRSQPSIPQRMAGTLVEFPVDTSTTDKFGPTNVMSQTFTPAAGSQGGSPPTVQAPANMFPPGLQTATLPQVAGAMTSATYQGASGTAPVHVHVLQAGSNTVYVGQFAKGISDGSGGSMNGVRMQGTQGQIYDGYVVRSPAILVYVLANAAAGNIIVLYAPEPESFVAVERLAGGVGNGQGLLDYPQVAGTFLALPAAPPPGYSLAQVRGFTEGEIQSVIGQTKSQVQTQGGGDAELENMLNEVVQTVGVLIPKQGTIASYEDGRGGEKVVMIGDYGSGGGCGAAWRTLSWTLGWGMKKDSSRGFDVLVMTEGTVCWGIFRKGPYIGLVTVPSSGGEAELLDLAASLQF